MTPADLKRKAAQLRLTAFETAVAAGKGHIPPALSWADICAVLFYDVLNLRPTEPSWPQRDRFILSKGHGCLVLYAALADLGFFDSDELKWFERPGAMLAGHPDINIPGIEVCSGSLGHGLGIGAGMAMAAQLDGASWRTFVLLGDGEMQEGSVWEAVAFAGRAQIRNLVAIVDHNGLGATERLKPDAMVRQFLSFGWYAEEINGHDVEALPDILRHCGRSGPFAFIANTIKGRGVSFMEDSPLWHHKMPKGDEIERARAELILDEDMCIGHVASANDPKICGRCGIHVDSLR